VAVKALEPFLPVTRRSDRWTFDYNRPLVGRVKAYYIRRPGARTGLHLAYGGEGLPTATMDAVLNANYIRRKLEPHFDMPQAEPSMHECVFSDSRQAARGVRTTDIAKRLIDYGFHPYTVSFPMIVHGAMMIEPTETESKRELDLFVDALISIAKEVEEDSELVLKAPHDTRTSRVDEVTAARKPVLRWRG
jgi:glycine dehydrogenase subunit 2